MDPRAEPAWRGDTSARIKKVFHSTTQFAIAAYRTQLMSAAEMPNVVKIEAGYEVQPLSAYREQPAPPGPEEKEIRAKLARLAIGAGKTFDFKDL